MKITEKRVWNGYFKLDVVKADGITREVLRTKPAICLLLFNTETNEMVLINQTRLSMVSKKRPAGIMTEVVAGRLDKPGYTPEDIASDEAWHEAGIEIPPEKIELLNNCVPMASSAGMTDEIVYYAYGEITSKNIDFKKAIFGDPKENERITRIFFSLEQFENHICDDTHVFALKYWFLLKLEREKNQKRKEENDKIWKGVL